MSKQIKVMLVEDEAIVAKYMKMELELEGFEVTEFIPTGEEAVEKARTNKPDVVLMDIRLAGEMDGITAAEIIIKENGIPIIFMTSYSKLEITKRAKNIKPAGYFNKPVSVEDIKPVIDGLFKG
jgi:two-component system, response regulator PdtaR